MIGVLALQGAFHKHIQCLGLLNTPCLEVRKKEDLKKCLALILPGGESTAHQKLLDEDFFKAIKTFGKMKPIFGTCCGLILLAKKVLPDNMRTFELLDVTVSRNAYGPQIESFETTLSSEIPGVKEITGCFIRAPQIINMDKNVRVLASYNNQPVIIQQGNILAATFHAEVSLDLSLHRYFLEMINDQILNSSKRI